MEEDANQHSRELCGPLSSILHNNFRFMSHPPNMYARIVRTQMGGGVQNERHYRTEQNGGGMAGGQMIRD